jgi:hypothetical protein
MMTVYVAVVNETTALVQRSVQWSVQGDLRFNQVLRDKGVQ